VAKKISAQDLNLKLSANNEREIFKWFLACFLMGKRIQQEIARKAYEEFIKAGKDTPQKLLNADWQELVDILGKGHYVRYDESTASNIHDWARHLKDHYGGKLTQVYKQSDNQRDLERRLQEFKGVGPKTTQIFMRDMADIWKF
jgi:endonuclease III